MAYDQDTEKKVNGFPSDFVSPEVKASKEFWLAVHNAVADKELTSENGFRGEGAQNRDVINRAFCRAEQSIDEIKPQLGVRNKKTKNDPDAQVGYKVLSWDNLGIAPKFINVLIGKLLKQNNDVGINAIDKRAQDERRAKRMELKEYVINGKFLQDVTAQTGITFQTPVQDDVIPPPENMGEIDMHMQMFYKEPYCLAVQDLLKEIAAQDNYENIAAEFARDLCEVGFGVTRVYPIGNKIMRRRCMKERMGSSSTLKDNFEDVKWIYEDWDLTIGQLKEIAADQFTEKEYRQIAEKATSSNFGDINEQDYFRQHYCYPWDNTKITVRDLVYFSPDWQTYQVGQTQIGNVTFSKKEYDWWDKLQKKGVTEEAFNAKNESKVIRYPIDNQYQAMRIKGTDFVFNYGLCRDMLKNESTVGRTISPFTIYRLKKPIIETVIPVIKNIQLNWMQYQHHAARSIPTGVSIEMSALKDISLEGAGGARLKPKEALRMYFDTGILVWRRVGADGTPNNWKPIEQLENGLNPAAAQHFQNIVNNINLLRDIVGLNELTDASTPNSEMGKAVATMASGASEDALRYLHFAFDQINLGTHEKTVMHITGMARAGLAPHYAEAIGMDSMATLQLMSDLTHHQLGCYLQKKPSAEMQLRMAAYVAEGIKAQMLYPEEALEIENEPNVYRQIKLLKMYRTQKMRQAQEQAQRDIQANTQSQITSAQAKAQSDAQIQEMDWAAKGQYEWTKAEAQMAVNKAKAANDAFLVQMQITLETGQALTEEQERRVTELQKEAMRGNFAIQVARMKPKPASPKGPSK